MFNAVKAKSALKAPALKPNDRVAILASGSRPRSPGVVAQCKRVIEQMGFQPVLGAHILNVQGFMAGTDEERLSDLNTAIRDESIAALFFVTGGYGALHLLNRIDYEALERQPKVMLGCDDNTVLLNAVNVRTGLITFHGPNIEQIKSLDLMNIVKETLSATGILSKLSALNPSPETLDCSDFYCAVAGTVEGRLVGGNLTALVSLLGTKFEPIFKNGIIFLEDINEQNGILDRWFTSLYLAGHLQLASGAMFGSFANCNHRSSYNMLSVMDTFGDRMKYLRKPACFGMPFGQTTETRIIPIGAMAKLDCEAGRLEFLETVLV